MKEIKKSVKKMLHFTSPRFRQGLARQNTFAVIRVERLKLINESPLDPPLLSANADDAHVVVVRN